MAIAVLSVTDTDMPNAMRLIDPPRFPMSLVHLDEELLERFVMNFCTAAEKRSIEQHLDVCSECSNRLAETIEWIGLVRAAL